MSTQELRQREVRRSISISKRIVETTRGNHRRSRTTPRMPLVNPCTLIAQFAPDRSKFPRIIPRCQVGDELSSGIRNGHAIHATSIGYPTNPLARGADQAAIPCWHGLG